MNTLVNIVTAIFVGTLIGGIVARVLNPNLWLLGSAIGGLFAYLSFNWKEVCTATYTYVKQNCRIGDVNRFKQEFMRGISAGIVLVSCLTTGLFHIIVILMIVIGPTQFLNDISLLPRELPGDYRVFLAIVFIGIPVASILDSLRRAISFSRTKVQLNTDEIGMNVRANLKAAKEASIPFVLRSEIKGLMWLLKRIPRACRGMCKLAKTVFVRIHSQKRLICGVDTAIGVTVGYLLGHSMAYVFVGMAIGIIAGLVNYYFVSVRLLKVQPA